MGPVSASGTPILSVTAPAPAPAPRFRAVRETAATMPTTDSHLLIYGRIPLHPPLFVPAILMPESASSRSLPRPAPSPLDEQIAASGGEVRVRRRPVLEPDLPLPARRRVGRGEHSHQMTTVAARHRRRDPPAHRRHKVHDLIDMPEPEHDLRGARWDGRLPDLLQRVSVPHRGETEAVPLEHNVPLSPVDLEARAGEVVGDRRAVRRRERGQPSRAPLQRED